MAKVNVTSPGRLRPPKYFFLSFRWLTLTFKYIIYFFIIRVSHASVTHDTLWMWSVYDFIGRRAVGRSTHLTGRCFRRSRHTLFTIFAASNSSFGIFCRLVFKIKHENIWLVAFIIRLGCFRFLRMCSLNVKINNMFNGCNYGCGINGGANNMLWDELGDITSF